jgi:hypothetical protein
MRKVRKAKLSRRANSVTVWATVDVYNCIDFFNLQFKKADLLTDKERGERSVRVKITEVRK